MILKRQIIVWVHSWWMKTPESVLVFYFLLFFSKSVLVHKPDFSEVVHQDLTVLKLWESSAYLSILFLLIIGLCDLSVHPRTVSARLHHTLIHNNYRSHMHLDFLDAAVESVANFCEDSWNKNCKCVKSYHFKLGIMKPASSGINLWDSGCQSWAVFRRQF